jgi:hypothetical protein
MLAGLLAMATAGVYQYRRAVSPPHARRQGAVGSMEAKLRAALPWAHFYKPHFYRASFHLIAGIDVVSCINL